ncbi:hypothetical protein SAMN02745121_08644 [Nannocystis exedens]|uniref:Uncharacterized protein n=2 Tax=Nannocystis exedens TaxID=54 RepID=A0A1I2IFJ2_9BACT|nr:hypothetical protein [Nannocystis exedens]PCC68239.1 hypothetical protein NAEX_01249 [Nannocystis exedens]SFF40433.1 hypothetical protein SAMN02745121_08644 [Nannocystis exedens]
MSNTIEQSVATVSFGPAASEDPPRVEVIEGALCTISEVRRAVAAGALMSGLVCTVVGVGIGFYLGLRDGRDGR